MGDPRHLERRDATATAAVESAPAHVARACELEARGELDEAATELERALAVDRDDREARRKLAVLLMRLGRREESLDLWEAELRSGEDGVAWVHAAIVDAMRIRDLSIAGDLATLYAAWMEGSAWYPPEGRNGRNPDPAATAPSTPPWLSIGKVEHDVEQFRHLQRAGVLGDEFDAVVAEYEEIANRLRPGGINSRCRFEGEDAQRIGHVYSRIVHVAGAPRVARALSPTWDPADVEHRYLHEPPGVVVIDDFLCEEALESVRRFCLESTVWSVNRYDAGRLGALFMGGFSCPLLVQIAEEIRDALPRVIGDQHALQQLWGFKNAATQRGDSTIHADFAAVNVNFWITPESANLDESSGGLVVYDVTAPLSWDFKTYNEGIDVIKQYLAEQGARAITIPYRQNRAIIFNSDLFHATAKIEFRPGYENRRVNITMLYGDRAEDRHHPSELGSAAIDGRDAAPAWRSGAFARNRRR